MIRLIYFGLIVYLAVTLLGLISRKLRSAQHQETPASEAVIDVEAKNTD